MRKHASIRAMAAGFRDDKCDGKIYAGRGLTEGEDGGGEMKIRTREKIRKRKKGWKTDSKKRRANIGARFVAEC